MPDLRNILVKSPKPVVVDVETTGFGTLDRVVEIAAEFLDRCRSGVQAPQRR